MNSRSVAPAPTVKTTDNAPLDRVAAIKVTCDALVERRLSRSSGRSADSSPPPAAPLQRPQERHGRSVGVPEDERLHEQRALPVDPRGLPSDRLWAHLHERAVDQIGQATDPRTRRRAASEAIPYRRPLDAPPLSERLARATSSSMAGAAANACVRERNGR